MIYLRIYDYNEGNIIKYL